MRTSKNTIKSILFVGPLLPPIHGQALAFTRFYESISTKNKILVNTNLEDKTKFSKVFNTFKTLYLILLKSLFYKYDTVYFTCSRSFLGSLNDIVVINLSSIRNKKIINHLHGSDFYDFLHNSPDWYQNILIKSYSKIDTSIVLLESMKSQFQDFPDMKVKVISNFYDNELNQNFEKKNGEIIHLLYLSNIMKSKGIFELIEAFNSLSIKYENIYLNIAGGFIADEFMSISEIKKQFLETIYGNLKINYIGKIFGSEKIKLLQKSDIFILPSYYKSEAFPLSILEAMKCENAIVTTNYKYLPEVVRKENGILVEIKSVKSLINGIDQLLSNEPLLRTIQNHNKIEAEQKYSLDKYISELKKLF